MRKVLLNLTRVNTTKPSPRNVPRGSAIVRRDREKIKQQRKVSGVRPRGIPEDRIEGMIENLPVYLEGDREHVFKTNVVRHANMHTLLGIQSKVFNAWLTRGKVPFAAYCVQTGHCGFPPKAYLEEEARALVAALNTHYNEHLTFRDTDLGLRRNIHASLKIHRDRKAAEHANSRIQG